MYSEIFTKDVVEQQLTSLLERIEKELSKVDDLVLIQKDDGLSFETKYQFIMSLKTDNQVQKILLEQIIFYALKSEKFCPGTFDSTIQNIAEKRSNLRGGFDQSIFENISAMARRHSQIQDLDNLIFDQLTQKDPLISSIVKSAIDLSGFGGKISIQRSESSTPSVELVNGYTFYVNLGWDLSTCLLKPRIVCIDGYVESVSEIHHLLESFGETKETGLILARGFSNDVLHTLRINWDRGSLKVVPAISSFDLEGMNMLVDIATVSCGDVVSSSKGELISSIRIENHPTVDEIHVSPRRVVIRNKRGLERVKEHLNKLKEKREEKSEIEDVSRLIDKRIRSLIPNQAVIRIPNDSKAVLRTQLIDLALRKISFFTSFGVDESNNELKISGYFSQLFWRNILNIGGIIFK